MSAFQALDVARAAGIEVRLAGKQLELSASREPPPDVLDMLRRHKLSIVAILDPTQPWDPVEWLAYFDERAGIAEFDGGLPRAEAEERAYGCCITEWLSRTAVISAPGPCPVCGGSDGPSDPLLAIGIVGGRTWLHLGCVKVWCCIRRAKAVAAFDAMGIRSPDGCTT
jgi:hypothetical protein